MESHPPTGATCYRNRQVPCYISTTAASVLHHGHRVMDTAGSSSAVAPKTAASVVDRIVQLASMQSAIEHMAEMLEVPCGVHQQQHATAEGDDNIDALAAKLQQMELPTTLPVVRTCIAKLEFAAYKLYSSLAHLDMLNSELLALPEAQGNEQVLAVYTTVAAFSQDRHRAADALPPVMAALRLVEARLVSGTAAAAAASK